MKHSRFLAAVAVSALMLGAAPMSAWAETPADTLVIAMAIDDTISLDPAEVFEMTPTEILGNSYERLIAYDVKDVSQISGQVAESWTVAPDGMTISFKLKEGRTFASGNPITADDAVYSLVRAIKLNKSPAFIIGQFGLTPENVDSMVVKTGDYSFDLKLDKPYASSLVLYCLTSSVAAVVDSKLVKEHEANGDFGYDWLKTNYAGSGPFIIKEWRANEAVVLEANPNYSGEAPKLKRAIYKHVPEAATQRLMLEAGDADEARNLGAEEIAALEGNAAISIVRSPVGTIWYMGLNQKNPNLAKPEVIEAMKYLVDYAAVADTIMKGQAKVHQTFLPEGFMGATDSNPYSLDVAKAKELLAKAGLPDGFSVTMETRNSGMTPALAEAIQATMAQAGIKMELLPGDGQQVLGRYRAREHDIYIGIWGPDFQDPHTNADTFAKNPNNADDATSKPLAWRNAWDIPEMSAKTDAAMMEPDAAKRAQMYVDLQLEHQKVSPFVIMWQDINVAAVSAKVNGLVWGPSVNDYYISGASKQ